MARKQNEDTSNATGTVEASGFTFDMALPIPAATRASGPGTSEVAMKLEACPVGASFLMPAEADANITDAAEREKDFRDKARKLSNNVSGAIRRFKKKEGMGEREFTIRTVNSADLGAGVRVWRSK